MTRPRYQHRTRSHKRGFALLSLLAACSVESGRPPVARITATPSAIDEHDAFMTDVLLDATASSDPIDDPDGLASLAFAWAVTGDEWRFEDGDADSSTPTIRLQGERPATIRLTATDGEGDSATAELQMQLTVFP